MGRKTHILYMNRANGEERDGHASGWERQNTYRHGDCCFQGIYRRMTQPAPTDRRLSCRSDVPGCGVWQLYSAFQD
ncbi:hypothetical protein E2C01_011680 [Portunus trituberculatus]|uniref:Uncharacterized protein n=1 Tax=Portunus trituberculatus TaxID=210409 RepID=A0A5B7DC44_PORTR|nr:hypothetical protein [Portunus trituberculatus]